MHARQLMSPGAKLVAQFCFKAPEMQTMDPTGARMGGAVLPSEVPKGFSEPVGAANGAQRDPRPKGEPRALAPKDPKRPDAQRAEGPKCPGPKGLGPKGSNGPQGPKWDPNGIQM